MKHTTLKRTLAVILMCCTLAVTDTYAETTQSDIDNAKDQITDLENKKEEVEDQVDDLTNQKESLEQNLSSLNSQLGNLTASINELEEKMAAKEQEIDTAKENLARAEDEEKVQYAAMKQRIQYTYENGSTTVWQMLLESQSISEFLNRKEYVDEMNQYDRKKLTEYQELQRQISEQKATLEGQKDELAAMQEEMEKKQDSVNSLIAGTKSQISESAQNIADAQSDVDALDAKIAKMVEYEKQLEIQKAKEDAARLAAIKEEEKEDTSGVVYVPTDSDAYLLGAIIECESGGEPYEGKLAVGSVIMNRVKSSYFPNSISGVIYQGGQFSPAASGRLAYRLEAGVSSSCLQAAQEVLNGNITTSCLYFRANNGIIQGMVIGNHVFY